MKVLITGIAGFVGSHLAELLLEQRRVILYGIERKQASIKSIERFMGRIKGYHRCDINDFKSLKALIGKIKPDFIIHLAAQSSSMASWNAPVETMETNVIGEVKLFEALRAINLRPRILLIGSCQEYGFVNKKDIPIKESCALRPANTYAVSKIAQDYLGFQYHRSYGFNIIRTRPFHHTGPGQGENFVCSNFAKQIAAIERGVRRPVIEAGNLRAKRDFTDVRDMVKAYWLAIQKGRPGEVYNICSGRGYSVESILDILLSFSKRKVKIRHDPKRMRPNDIPVFIGDCSKLRKLTGWKPEIPFERTLEDLLDYWREKTIIR